MLVSAVDEQSWSTPILFHRDLGLVGTHLPEMKKEDAETLASKFRHTHQACTASAESMN